MKKKIPEVWISGDGFKNYPDPEYADDYDRLSDPLFNDCSLKVVPDGQSVPFAPGDIILTDLQGGHRVIVTDVFVTPEGYEYEGVPLSADDENNPNTDSVKVNDYNSILDYGLLAPKNYGICIYVHDLYKFTPKNICRKEYFSPFKGKVNAHFMQTLKSWLGYVG